MKKTVWTVSAAMLLFVVISVFASSGLVWAEEVKVEESKWTPTAEVTFIGYNSNVGGSGAVLHEKPFLSQSLMAGVAKGETGVSGKAENISASGNEPRETDLYVDLFTEVAGMKIGVGYGRYWIREAKALDCNGVYMSIDFPAPFFGITPFLNMEYDFSEKLEGVDMNGLFYRFGVKKEFQIFERVSLTAEISFGGNSGVYGLPAENLAFARESVDFSVALLKKEVSVLKQLNINVSAMTQQILGLQDGIAKDTDRLFVSLGMAGAF